MTLAAPALRDQWWFADGEAGEGITETFAIYNPTDDDVQVDVVFLGIPVDALAGDNTIDVPARQVVVYDPAASGTGEDGAAAAAVPPGPAARRSEFSSRRLHRFGRHDAPACRSPQCRAFFLRVRRLEWTSTARR